MHDLWPKVVEETKTRTHLSYVHGKGEKQHKPITVLNVITNCVLPSFFYKKDTEAEARRVKEAIHIRLHPNNINRDNGIEISEA